MSIFIISDLHFGHENLAIKRGFKNAEEQDDYIIENWNKVVNKRDLVIIPGDISMEKKVHVQKLQLLKGFKHVIPGNHDIKNISELLKYCQKVTGPIEYKKKMWITHFPIHPRELYGKFNVHGHVHEKTIPDNRYFNISAENIGYVPMSMDSLIEILNKRAIEWGQYHEVPEYHKVQEIPKNLL